MLEGRASTSVAYALIARLPYEPWSLYRARELGGPEHLGWSTDTYLATEQLDATMIGNALLANQGSKKRPKFPDPAYRPKHKKEVVEVKSIKDLPIQSIVAQMRGT